MYGLRGGAVPVPRWILILRDLQLLFAILTLAMCAYSLSVFSGGPLKPALISTIIIAILAIIPILLLTTPLHLAQRKMYDSRIALLDIFAMLYWLATFAVFASYHRIYGGWGRNSAGVVFGVDFCRNCRTAWRTGVAATVFSAMEFLLFLATTLAFLYYYHFHLAERPAPGLGHHTKTSAGVTSGTTTAGTHGTELGNTSTGSATMGGNGLGSTGATTSHHRNNRTGAGTRLSTTEAGLAHPHTGEQPGHQMGEIPHHPQHSTTSPGVGNIPYSNAGNAGHLSGSHQTPIYIGQNHGPPYPTQDDPRSPRQPGGG